MVAKSRPNPTVGRLEWRLGWPAWSVLHPPVQHGDLGRTENVDVDVFSLESHRGYLGLGHLADCDMSDVVAHQADPGPLQHVGGGCGWTELSLCSHCAAVTGAQVGLREEGGGGSGGRPPGRQERREVAQSDIPSGWPDLWRPVETCTAVYAIFPSRLARQVVLD